MCENVISELTCFVTVEPSLLTSVHPRASDPEGGSRVVPKMRHRLGGRQMKEDFSPWALRDTKTLAWEADGISGTCG